MSGPLKAGHLVYRVVEVDPPDASPHTWKVASVVVEKASDRQIKLRGRFDGLGNIRFEPNAFGRLFFETPLQAIQFFLTERQLETELLARKRKTAERAIAWASSQAGMAP
jgi:hypothetical protein